MNTVSRVGSVDRHVVHREPARLGGGDDARAAGPPTPCAVSKTVLADDGGAGDAVEIAEHGRRARSRSPSALIRTTVSAPTVRFSAAGVSSASSLPWSMIATRSQSWSASSM